MDHWVIHFSVKKQPKTYCIFETYFTIKSLWKNCIDFSEVNTPHRAKKVEVDMKIWKSEFSRLQDDVILLGGGKRY